MVAGYVPNGAITPLYENTTPGTVASPVAVDGAVVAMVQTINDNWQAFYDFVIGTIIGVPDGAVTTPKIRDLAITTQKIAELAVVNSKIADGTISTQKLANAIITTLKLADASVTNSKLSELSVTVSKIADGTISTQKLMDALITSAKLGNGAVTEQKLSTGSVSTRVLADRSVTAGKLDPSLVAPISDAGIQYKFGLVDEKFLEISINAKYPGNGLTGIKQDGSDDSIALNNIINFVKSTENTEGIPNNPVKYKILLPPGTTHIYSTVLSPSYIHIVGAGKHTTFLQSHITDGSPVIQVSQDSSGSIDSFYNTLSDFTINGNSLNCIGILMKKCHRWSISRVIVNGCNYGGIKYYEAYLGEVYSLYVRGCGDDSHHGIYYTGPDSNFGSHAITMVGGEVQGCQKGIFMEYGVSCSLTGVTIEGNAGVGIEIESPISFTVSNCYFELNSNHIRHLGGSSNIVNCFFGKLNTGSSGHIVINNIYNSIIQGNSAPDTSLFCVASTANGPLFMNHTKIINNQGIFANRIDSSLIALNSVGNVINYFDGINAVVTAGKQAFKDSLVFKDTFTAEQEVTFDKAVLIGGEVFKLNGTLAGMTAGAGTPEGNVFGVVGKVYHRTDGAIEQGVYVKSLASISGNSNRGWLPFQPILSFTTATRPTVGTAGVSGFDITLGKPVWRNAANSAWVDNNGTIV